MTPTEPIYVALFSLASTGEGLAGAFTWSGGGPFVYTSRRVKTFDDLTGKQPALCQAEHDETVAWKTNQDPIITLGASWLIYLQDAGPGSGLVPATTTNAVLDAVKALFVDSGPDGVQRLEMEYAGGVYRVWIEGKIQKFQGDLDGQTLLVVPLRITVPTF